MKRNHLRKQFGILEHPFGYDATANSDSKIVYATVCDDGNYTLNADTILNLPGWHQVFLMNALGSKMTESLELMQSEYIELKREAGHGSVGEGVAE